MLVPIRCFTCGKPLAHLWNDYLKMLQDHNNIEDIQQQAKQLTIKDEKIDTPEKRALDKLGIDKYCCRNVMLGVVDMTEKITR